MSRPASGARWAGQAENGWRTASTFLTSVRLFGWCRTGNAPRGERHPARNPLVVPSLRRARREAGHGLASFWPASDANARRSPKPGSGWHTTSDVGLTLAANRATAYYTVLDQPSITLESVLCHD